MGTIYEGKIEALHIEKDTVIEAKVGQKAGLKIPHFRKAKVGDLVECYEIPDPKGPAPWQPKGGVLR